MRAKLATILAALTLAAFGAPALTQEGGVEVIAVEKDSPADQAGLTEEDVIVSLGEQPVVTVDDLHKLLTQLPVEVPSPIVMLRGERQLERWVVPNEYPARG